MSDSITYAKPLLHDAPLCSRLRHIALVTRLTLRCAIKGHEWRSERPTRCVSVTACRICGSFIGSSVTAQDATCHWARWASRAGD